MGELKQLFSTNSIKKVEFDVYLKNLMKEVDKNKDNFISYEEFNDALTTLLHKSFDQKERK